MKSLTEHLWFEVPTRCIQRSSGLQSRVEDTTGPRKFSVTWGVLWVCLQRRTEMNSFHSTGLAAMGSKRFDDVSSRYESKQSGRDD